METVSEENKAVIKAESNIVTDKNKSPKESETTNAEKKVRFYIFFNDSDNRILLKYLERYMSYILSIYLKDGIYFAFSFITRFYRIR